MKRFKFKPVEALLIAIVMLGALSAVARMLIEHSDWKSTAVEYEVDEEE